MKKVFTLAMAAIAGIMITSCSSLNQARLGNATAGAITALTLSDAQVAQMSAEAVKQMDAQHSVAPANNPYTIRLNKLTANMQKQGSLQLNYKVYLLNEINAFATGDGSIRVYSGLMDVMDDSELVAILGHEIGHVANSDVKDAMKNAYLNYAAREAVRATSDKVAVISDSLLGDLVIAYTEAQFSQKQEFAADDFGYNVSVQQGYSPYSMSNALSKLVSISNGAQASTVQKMFSSHPDSATRAQRMKEKADKAQK